MNSTRVQKENQTGFGLVELMIAMTLGLILLGGIGYLYIGSRGAFRTTDNLSRIQENARFALDMMGRDIRMAGYLGCGNLSSMQVTTIANAPVPQMTPGNALIGYDAGAGWVNPTAIARVAGTDVLSVMGAFSSGVNLSGNLIPQNANVQISGNPDGFQANDVLVVTNCVNADVFRATSVASGGGITTVAHANSSNTGNRVGVYSTDAFVMRVDQYSYFVGTNPGGNPALYRVGLNGNAEELVENVQNLQIRYGLDTNNNGAVDSYSDAPGNWQQVASVTLNLLLRGADNNVATAAQVVIYNNGTFNAPDNRLYQVFSATVGVRNRMPPM